MGRWTSESYHLIVSNWRATRKVDRRQRSNNVSKIKNSPFEFFEQNFIGKEISKERKKRKNSFIKKVCHCRCCRAKEKSFWLLFTTFSTETFWVENVRMRTERDLSEEGEKRRRWSNKRKREKERVGHCSQCDRIDRSYKDFTSQILHYGNFLSILISWKKIISQIECLKIWVM